MSNKRKLTGTVTLEVSEKFVKHFLRNEMDRYENSSDKDMYLLHSILTSFVEYGSDHVIDIVSLHKGKVDE